VTERPYEIALLGASGFTGRLTAEYLARRQPDLRWALAGRNLSKLASLRERLAAINPALADLALLSADVDAPDSLRALAEQAGVVITTVGPYLRYGEPVVAACAAAGTDYVDLTGEPEFVDRMWLCHHERAQRSGARIVHSCGFDSIPFDLGVLFCVARMPENVPLRVEAFVSAAGGFSGGTYHSALEVLSRLRQGAVVAAQRRRLEERPRQRRVRAVARAPHRDPDAGGWVVPLPTIDPQHVLRSARALERYGPDFTYGHYLRVGSPAAVGAFALGVGGLVAAAQLPPTRKLLQRLRQPGEGPSEQQRARAWFSVKLRAQGGGRTLLARVSGGDPGYGETAKMLAESALCLARDQLPRRAGQLTPAVAMGEPLIRRLVASGIGFEILRDA
jgi:short subunit dehydrogenase-like uncharacterized protein